MSANESTLEGLVQFRLPGHQNLSGLGLPVLRNYFLCGQLSISFASIYTSQINHIFVLFLNVHWLCNSFGFFFFLTNKQKCPYITVVPSILQRPRKCQARAVLGVLEVICSSMLSLRAFNSYLYPQKKWMTPHSRPWGLLPSSRNYELSLQMRRVYQDISHGPFTS